MASNSPKIIELPKILDKRGNLSFIQNNAQIPFIVKRVFWCYDVPGGEIRGGHAYQRQQELIVALSGSFDVITNIGNETQIFRLNRSYYGLFVPSLCWRHIENFSTNSLSLHLSDSVFDENDYIRDFESFTKLVHA
jgi:WxcM-like, C-terminal